MGWTSLLYWLLPRRLGSTWPLLSITSFGIIAAVTLMAVGAIYSRALAEGGLRHTLAAISPRVLNVHVITQNRPMGPADYQKLRSLVEDVADSRLGNLLRTTERYGFVQGNLRMVLLPSDGPPSRDAPVGRPFFLTGLQEHSFIVEGRWPQGSPVLVDRGVALEAVVGARTAKQMGLAVGSRVDLVPFRSDPTERISITVVGLADAKDPNEEYWMNSPIFYFSVPAGDGPVTVPFFITEETFFGGVGTKYPSMVGDFTWFLFLDTDVLTSSQVKQTKDALKGLETDVNRQYPRSLVLSGLKIALEDYQRELMLARVPLFLFISLMVLVILYFLALIMGLLAQSRMDEASLLRSRGGSILQISGLLVAGEGVVALLAMVVGPLLALLIVRYLLLSTIIPAGGTGESLSVGLSADMFLMGVAGGLLSLVVLVASSVGRARLGMVESLEARARPPTLPLLQRYYIDLLVLAAVIFLLWEIQDHEGFVVRDLSSRALKVDFVLLFGPVLGLVGSALLLMRLLPWLVRLLAWSADRLGPAWVAFPLARLARDPIPHGSLVIILMLASALGVFGATFQSTLSLSQTQQALYFAGGDIVFSGSSLSLGDDKKLAGEPLVKSYSPVVRDSAILLDGLPGVSADLLAIDPDAMSDLVWFREDFADKDLPELLQALQPLALSPLDLVNDSALGIAIPGDAQRLGIWVESSNVIRDNLNPGLTLWARVYDAGGRFHNLQFGDILATLSSRIVDSGQTTEGDLYNPWVYFEAELPEKKFRPEEPFRLVSIYFSRKSFVQIPPGRISLDDIIYKTPSGPVLGVLIEGFEEPGRWVPMVNQGQVVDTVELTSRAARSGGTGLEFVWKAEFSDLPRGVVIPPGPFPIPAIGGPNLHPGQVIRVRVGKQLFPVIVGATMDYFPTLYPSSRTFLIVPLEGYRQYVRRASQGSVKSPAEFWVSLQPGADRNQAITALKERFGGFVRVQDRNTLVETAQRNPLAGGGWNGLTILGLSAITVAVLLTLVIHAVVAIHAGRVDLTVAQTLGFSKLQIVLSLALERILMAVVGLGAGAAVGTWLGRWVMGFLDITTRGGPAIPPMIIEVHQWLLTLVLAGLVVASFLGLLVAAVSAHRLRVADILRAGE